MKGKCPKCGKRKPLTKHSECGNHKPPFERICRKCHDRKHPEMVKRLNRGRKYQPGTPKFKIRKK